MCVIILKPADIEMPSLETLDACKKANPHGFGIMSPSVQYKGFNYKTFLRKLARVPAHEPCAIHFRYATHGSIKVANCHPFRNGDLWFMHNGVLSITPDADKTDSQTMFDRHIAPAVHKYGFGSDKADEVIEYCRQGCRFALMQGSTINLYGDFKEGDDGCMYSNFNFRWALRSHRALADVWF